MDLTKIESRECDTYEELGTSSGDPMIKSEEKKFDFVQETSSVNQMLGFKQPCNMALIVLVVFLLLGIVALLIVHFTGAKVEVSQEENESEAMFLGSHHLRTPGAPSFFAALLIVSTNQKDFCQ